MRNLDLHADPVEIAGTLVDIPSPSGEERDLADAVETALRAQTDHLEIVRHGDAVLARTDLGRPSRVILAGHLDTVPANENLPGYREEGSNGGWLHGLGSVDMKGGDAVFLSLAARLIEPAYELTFIFYDCEEVEASRNGLNRVERDLPGWLRGELAVVGEPSNAVIEAGCQGSLRFELHCTGERAHTARAWMGINAIHGLEQPLRILAEYRPRIVDIDGLSYREGLQAVRIAGGVSGNVVPDSAVVTINHRFAPDRTLEQAEEHMREVFDGYHLNVIDRSAPALPGLRAATTGELVAASGEDPVAKLGWTDVARFAARGMPAVNFGPGDPTLAHTKAEHVATAEVSKVADVLTRFLQG